MALCRRGKVDLILVKSISRFARNALDCIDHVRKLKAMNVGVLFEEQNINTLTMDSEMVLTMLSAFAQAESESISANVRWGKRHAMKQGFNTSKLSVMSVARITSRKLFPSRPILSAEFLGASSPDTVCQKSRKNWKPSKFRPQPASQSGQPL